MYALVGFTCFCLSRFIYTCNIAPKVRTCNVQCLLDKKHLLHSDLNISPSTVLYHSGPFFLCPSSPGCRGSIRPWCGGLVPVSGLPASRGGSWDADYQSLSGFWSLCEEVSPRAEKHCPECHDSIPQQACRSLGGSTRWMGEFLHGHLERED